MGVAIAIATVAMVGRVFNAAPTITSISVANGSAAGGDTVTFTGTGLSGVNAGSLGSALTNVVSVNDTTVTATTTAHAAGLVSASLSNPVATSATLSNCFTYWVVPSISGSTIVATKSGVAVANFEGGAAITGAGASNLTGATGATIGGVAVSGFTVDSDSTWHGVAPALAASATAYNLVISNPGASGTKTAAFTAWSPDLSTGVRAWWWAGDYDPTTGNWPKAGGPATSTTWAQATAGQRPSKSSSDSNFNNQPSLTYDHVDDRLAGVSGVNTLSNATKYIYEGFRCTAIATNSGTPSANDELTNDGASALNIQGFRSAGPVFQFSTWDGAYKTAAWAGTPAFALNTAFIGTCRQLSSKCGARLNNGTFTETATAAGGSTGIGSLQLGKGSGNTFFGGQQVFLMLCNADPGAHDINNLAYFATRCGIQL